ncbi:lysoplasmalogenase [Luteimonas aquatica]|uniref:lysoplasmalogenase n=1 Tax=Luteimonas aquatica TaxID=450364 RepID=UPI001F585B4E|nr:lysoplasmalogenase [Luteimonas aquatica]
MSAAALRAWIAAIALSAALAIAGAYAPGAHWLHLLCKPLTTLLIVALALRLPASETGYRRAIVAGLLLSTLGDVFLMLAPRWFVHGLASFLLAHLAYLFAFTRCARLAAVPWPFAAYALVAGGVLAMLWPSLPVALRVPVVVYVAVLAAMAAQAAVVWRVRAEATAAWGAAGGGVFVLSDAVLATDRFAMPFAAASLVVLAAYWLAQTMIALSVGKGPATNP